MTSTYAKLLIRTESKSAKNLCHPDETEFQSNWLEMVEQRILGLFAMVTVVSSLPLTLLCNFSHLMFFSLLLPLLPELIHWSKDWILNWMKYDYMNLYAVGKNCEVKLQQHLGSTSFDSAVIIKNLLRTEQLMTIQKPITWCLHQGVLWLKQCCKKHVILQTWTAQFYFTKSR